MSREFDVIIHGATSYTAKLCIKYLFDRYGPSGQKFKYALAGRNRSKIEDVITEMNLPLDTPIRECNLDFQKLSALARETTVIVNFVGPFANYGELVVKACLEENTHYVDSSGEIDWCHLLSNNYHHKAVEQGIKLLPCMGFDYTGFEMGMAILRHATPGVWRGAEVIVTTSSNTKGASHGTLHTGLRALEEGPIAPSVPNVALTQKKNRFIIPKICHGHKICPTLMGPGCAAYLEWLNSVFLHGRWSNGDGSGAPMSLIVGDEVSDYMSMLTKTIGLLSFFFIFVLMLILPLSVRNRLIPSSGGGSDIPHDGYVSHTLRLFKADDDVPISTVNMKFNKGECYVFTGITCIESALTIALENENDGSKSNDMLLPVNYPTSGGVGSGSILLGDAYRRRLQASGIEFNVVSGA